MAQAIVAPDQEMKEEEERSWSDLPSELLSLILTHLFAGDYITFHAICRYWRSISPISQPLLLPLPIDSPLSQYPYLMFYSRKTHSFHFFHPICNAASYEMDIPGLSKAEIRYSKYDWLLMSQGDLAIFFFNPFTKVRIDLPDIPLYYGFNSMCFSSPPTSPDCLVIGFSSVGNSAIDICTLKLGEGVWSICELYEHNTCFRMSNCGPVLCNGLYYCLGDSGNLGMFDPTSNDGSWTVCVKPLQQLGNSQQSYIVESDGDLFSVFVSHEGRHVYVFKLDFSKKTWRKVQSLGDKMLYVSIRASFSETAVVRGTGNKVYFPRFHGEDNKGVFYSLATRKYHCFTGNYYRDDLYETRDMKHCTWVKPCLQQLETQ